MASHDTNANVTAGFIDLATYDSIEKFLYGPDASDENYVSYFVRQTKRSSWFTQVPVMLSIVGTPDFGQTWSAKISKSGDYLLNSWLQFRLPPISTSGNTQVDESLNPILKKGAIAQGNTRWIHPIPNLYLENTTGTGGNGSDILFTISSGDTVQVQANSNGLTNAHSFEYENSAPSNTAFVVGAGLVRCEDTSTGQTAIFEANASGVATIGPAATVSLLAPQDNAVLDVTQQGVSGVAVTVGQVITFTGDGGPGNGFQLIVVSVDPNGAFTAHPDPQNLGSGYHIGQIITPDVLGVNPNTITFTITETSGLSGGVAGGQGYTATGDLRTHATGNSVGSGIIVRTDSLSGNGAIGPISLRNPGDGYRVGDIFRILPNNGVFPTVFAYGVVDSIVPQVSATGVFVSGVVVESNTTTRLFVVHGTIRNIAGIEHTGLLSVPATQNYADFVLRWDVNDPPTTWNVQLTDPGKGYKPGNVITIDGGPRSCRLVRNPRNPTEFEEECVGLGGITNVNNLEITLTQEMFSDWYAQVEWTTNLAHNLVRECSLICNDLVVARFDNYVLDFWTRFIVPQSKLSTYYDMTDSTYAGGSWNPFANQEEVSDPLILPLPFFYSRDSGIALPTAALPYNDLRIKFEFRDWNELLVLYARNSVTDASQQHVATRFVPKLADLQGGVAPTLRDVQVWSHYALVSNEERKRMTCAPRALLMEETITSPIRPFTPFVEAEPVFNLNMMNAVKMIFFGARNVTHPNDWSNYSTASIVNDRGSTGYYARDPFDSISLMYEGVKRLTDMPREYFRQIQPFLYAPATTSSSFPTGIYFYSYALDGINIDPTGSTNFSALEQVSIRPRASRYAIESANPVAVATADPDSGWGNGVQRYEFVAVGVANNVLLIDGGSLRFALATPGLEVSRSTK